MKKVLGISLVALFTVAPFAADAALTSKGYVDGQLELKQDKSTAVKFGGSAAVGSASNPVYIDAQGNATAITSYDGTAAQATADASGNTITDTYQRIDNMVKDDSLADGTADSVKKTLYPSYYTVEKLTGDVAAAAKGDVSGLTNVVNAMVGTDTARADDVLAGGDGVAGAIGVAIDELGRLKQNNLTSTGDYANLKRDTADGATAKPFVKAITAADGTVTYTTDGITSSTGSTSGTVVKGVSVTDGKTVGVTLGSISNADVATGANIAQSKIEGLTSALAAKATVTALEEEASRAQAAEGLNADAITAEVARAERVESGLQSAINTLNGNDSTDGSVAKAVKDATDTLNASLGALAHLEIPATCKTSGSNCVLVYKGSQGFVLEDIERANGENVKGQTDGLATLPKQS